jgi:3D-(3,5/4)-trihydroxycyclohexane-1,2-dione acylhydrolase (decyclizing)
MLKDAKRPMIVAGGGVHYSEAWDQLRTFAETFGIPVSETFGGRGALRGAIRGNDSPMQLGPQGLEGTYASAKVSAEANLVIAIGTRLADFTTGSQSCFHNPRVRFAAINVAGHDAFKMGALPVVADAREALSALHKAARDAGIKPNKSYAGQVAGLKEKWNADTEKSIKSAASLSQIEAVRVISSQSRAGDTVIAASGSVVPDVLKFWDSSNGSNIHLEFGFSCMGYEIPAALGVRMANPKGEIYVAIGDGTYLMNPTELVTAVQEGWKITVILFENQMYKSIRGLQTWRAGPSFGNEFRRRDRRTRRLSGEFLAIDYATNAQSMGARAWRVTTTNQLQRALKEARAHDGPGVIVVATDPDHMGPRCGVWWDAEPAECSRRPAVNGARKAYESDRKRQRFYY